MTKSYILGKFLRNNVGAAIVFLVLSMALGCSVVESKTATPQTNSGAPGNVSKGATIAIDVGGPADTVRAFCKLLREKKFREAIFLTNLRPAVEGLTDAELKDFSLDFESIAANIPAEIEINGEIITGDSATVTANLPNEDGDKNELQKLKLRKEGNVWVILMVDDEAEKRIKSEGNKYFYNLRIETHQDEARKMMERIAKAEVAYSLQHDSLCADFTTLINDGLLPDDIQTSESTGYNYKLTLSENKRRYVADATPAEYGKSGKLSYILDVDDKGLPHIDSGDKGGQPLKK